MKLKCLLRGHKWKLLSFENYNDVSFSSKGRPSFTYTKICNYCHKIQSINVFGGGYIEKEDLRAVIETETKKDMEKNDRLD